MVEISDDVLRAQSVAKLSPAQLKTIFNTLPTDVVAVLKHITDDTTDTGTQSARTLATVEQAKEKDEKNKDLESRKTEIAMLVRTLQAQGKSEADIVMAAGKYTSNPEMANFARDVAKDEIAKTKANLFNPRNFPPPPALEQAPTVAKSLFAVLDMGSTTAALATGKPAIQHFAQALGGQQLMLG